MTRDCKLSGVRDRELVQACIAVVHTVKECEALTLDMDVFSLVCWLKMELVRYPLSIVHLVRPTAMGSSKMIVGHRLARTWMRIDHAPRLLSGGGGPGLSQNSIRIFLRKSEVGC